jgi:hypothetical protein
MRCCNGAMKTTVNVTPRQFLKDLAFTCLAAFGTGAAIGAVSFVVVRFFLS